MLPRIIHRVWLGGRPIPDRYRRFGETFRALNPEWELRLWTESELAGVASISDVPGGYGCQSNVARLRVLELHGGLYVDMDVECLKPLEEALGDAQAFCGWERPGQLVCNAVFGAAAHHPWLVDLIDTLPEWTRRPRPWGPSHMTSLIRRHPAVRVFPSEKFYPFAPQQRPPESYPPGSCMAHHWDKSWAST